MVQNGTNSDEENTSEALRSKCKEGMSCTSETLENTILVTSDQGKWAWMIVAASFVCNFLVDGIIFSGGIVSKAIQEQFEASDKAVAPVNSLLAGFYLMAGPFVSSLTNKYGFRCATIIGSIISCVAFVVSYFATSVEYLYISYGVLGGIGFCMTYMPAVVIVGFYFDKWRALATGLALCGSGVGTFILAPLTDKLIEAYDWQTAVLVHAGLILLCIICGIIFRPVNLAPITKAEKEAPNNIIPDILLPPDRRLIKTMMPRNYSDVINPRHDAEVLFQNGRHSYRRCSDTPCKTLLNATIKNKLENGNVNGLKTSKEYSLPILYPDDIMFYTGSLKRLPQYTSRTSGFHLHIDNVDKPKKCNGTFSVKNIFASIDLSLFRSPTFVLLAISGVFTFLGLFVPYMYVTQRAEDNGVSKTVSVLLVSTIGVANIIGRVATGLISSIPQISALYVYSTALSLGGVATMLSGSCYDEIYQFGYCAIFGLSIACFASLRSILIVEYIGLDKLTSCFGLFLLFQGFGALLGSPIAGALKDLTGNYDTAFYVSGGFILLSGVLCFPVDYISKWERSRLQLASENKLNCNL